MFGMTMCHAITETIFDTGPFNIDYIKVVGGGGDGKILCYTLTIFMRETKCLNLAIITVKKSHTIRKSS